MKSIGPIPVRCSTDAAFELDFQQPLKRLHSPQTRSGRSHHFAFHIGNLLGLSFSRFREPRAHNGFWVRHDAASLV